MTEGVFGMTNTVIRVNLRPFAKFAFGLFSQRFASLFPPFEGGEGGMFLCVRPVVIQSEAKNLFPFPREIPHCVRNDRGEPLGCRVSGT